MVHRNIDTNEDLEHYNDDNENEEEIYENEDEEENYDDY